MSPTVPLESFDLEAKEVVNFGDMAHVLNAPIDFKQTLVTLTPRSPHSAVWESFTTKDGISGYKSTNYAVPDVRMVVFHDSFMGALQWFLSEHFREVYYLPKFSTNLVVEVRPDFVLEEMVERYLMDPPPVFTAPTNSTPVLEARKPNTTSR